VPRILIGRIFPWCDADTMQMFGQLFAPKRQQGTNQLPPAWRDPRQSGRAGAAQHPHENRFDLVVLVVRGKDELGAQLFGEAGEPGITRLARRGLAGAATEPELPHVHRKAVAMGRGSHPLGDLPALGMNPVIGVRDVQRETSRRRHAAQQIEQRERIGSPGNRNQGRAGGESQSPEMAIEPLRERHAPSNGSM
jgi:hypothetical protein